jgi:hypothetical protein
VRAREIANDLRKNTEMADALARIIQLWSREKNGFI